MRVWPFTTMADMSFFGGPVGSGAAASTCGHAQDTPVSLVQSAFRRSSKNLMTCRQWRHMHDGTLAHRLSRSEGLFPEAGAIPEAWPVPAIFEPWTVTGYWPLPVSGSVPVAGAVPAARAISLTAARRLCEPLLHAPAEAGPKAGAWPSMNHASASSSRVPVAQALVHLCAKKQVITRSWQVSSFSQPPSHRQHDTRHYGKTTCCFCLLSSCSSLRSLSTSSSADMTQECCLQVMGTAARSVWALEEGFCRLNHGCRSSMTRSAATVGHLTDWRSLRVHYRAAKIYTRPVGLSSRDARARGSWPLGGTISLFASPRCPVICCTAVSWRYRCEDP